MSTLQFQMSIDELLSDDHLAKTSFNELTSEFGNDSNIFLLVSGNEDSMKAFALEIKPLLESFEKWISSVQIHALSDFQRENFIKLMSLDEFKNFNEVFNDPNLVPLLKNLNDNFEKVFIKSNVINGNKQKNIIDLLDRILIFIRIQDDIVNNKEKMDAGHQAVDALLFGERFIFSKERNMLLIILEPNFNIRYPLDIQAENINGIEDIVQEIAVKHGIDFGLIGPTIKNQYFYSDYLSELKLLIFLSMIGCFFILFLLFRSISVPILCAIYLIILLVWILGIYSFILINVNLISIFSLFICLLLGLSNCIVFLNAYLENVEINNEISIQKFFLQQGLKIINSGIVIIFILYSFILFKMKIFNDFGIMAIVGVFSMIIVTVFILPIIIMLKEKLFEFNFQIDYVSSLSNSFIKKGFIWINQYRWVTLIVILLITGIGCYHGSNLSWDFKLNSYYHHNLDDVLVENFGISSDVLSLVIEDLEMAREIVKEANNNRSIGFVESLFEFIPDERINEERFRYIREFRRIINHRELRKKLSRHDVNMYKKEIQRLEANIIDVQDFAIIYNELEVYEKTLQLVGGGTGNDILGILSPFVNSIDTGMNRLKLTLFQDRFSKALKSKLLQISNSEPLTMFNIPSDINNRFQSLMGNKLRINIYPHQKIWGNSDNLNIFLEEANSINEKFTGYSRLFQIFVKGISSYGMQIIFLLILSLLLFNIIHFKSMKISIIMVLSIIIGYIWMFGGFVLLNQSINIFNMWIFPIILLISFNHSIQFFQILSKERKLQTEIITQVKSNFLSILIIFIISFPIWFMAQEGFNSIPILLMLGLVSNLLSNSIMYGLSFNGNIQN